MNNYSIKPASATLFFDTRRQMKDGTYPVKLVIYFNGKKKRYDTKISLTIEQWEKVNSANLKDKTLKKKKSDLEAIKIEAGKNIDILGEQFTFDMFEQLFFDKEIKKKSQNQNVYLAFEEYIVKLKEEKRIGTAGSYRDALNSLRKFSAKLQFESVTVKFLEDYERHMIDDGKSATTIGMYLRSLRAIVNMARADKIISEEQYPFGLKAHRKYEIPAGNNVKKALQESDISKIISYEPLSEEEAKARDLCLFSFYCNGMNMVDIFNLKYEDIEGNFLYFYRKKTIRTRKVKEPVEIYISEPVATIISRWGNKERLNKNYIFDVLDKSMSAEVMHHIKNLEVRRINAYMKRIAKRLGIDAKVSTYVARHSWATTLLRNGVSTAYISKGFGHASFATTEQYLGGFTQDQKKDVAEIFTKLASA